MSPLFKLNSRDFLNGLVTVIFASVITYLYPLVTTQDFAFNQIDVTILVKVVFGAVVSFLGTKFLTAENGKIGGVI